MKILAIIFLWALVGQLSAQELSHGTFRRSTGFTTTTFKFSGHNQFYYKYSSCTGGEMGGGTYTIHQKHLVLHFENPVNMKLPDTPVVKRLPSGNDSTYISFDFDFDPWDSVKPAWVRVNYRERNGIRSLATTSNSRGQAYLKLANRELPKVITMSLIGYKESQITLDSSGIYNVHVPLFVAPFRPFVKGQTLEFLVSYIDNEELALKPIDAQEFGLFQRKED